MDLGMVPTPLIQYYMAFHPEIKAGVTITASFTGPDINGFRIMKSGGIEDPIFDEYTSDTIYDMDGKCVPGTQVGELFKVSDFTENYIDSILNQVDVDAIRKAGLRICLDCRNSAVAAIASNLLLMLSVDCITIGGDRSILDDDRMVKLGHVVKSQGLDLGVAIEMDADHVLFADGEGSPLQGDKSFAIIAKAILEKEKGKVVIPINSTSLMEDIVRDNGGTVVHSAVGEQSLVMNVKENDAVLGGDVFGCLVIPGTVCTCDAMFAMAKMLEIVVKNGPLGKLVESFPDYFISRGQFDCPDKEIPSVLDKFRSSHDGEKTELIDGVKIYRPNGWILVRRSNVKGIIKVYAQADSKEASDSWIKETIDSLKAE